MLSYKLEISFRAITSVLVVDVEDENVAKPSSDSTSRLDYLCLKFGRCQEATTVLPVSSVLNAIHDPSIGITVCIALLTHDTQQTSVSDDKLKAAAALR